MTARIKRRPTLVDGVAQAGRWWWRHWERFSTSGMARGEGYLSGAAGVGGKDAVHGGDRLRGDRADRNARSTSGGVRRVTPASLILGDASGGTRLDDPIRSNEDHPPQRVQRVEATKEDCPESLLPRRRSIAATRSVGSDGSVVESSTSGSPAVKRSSAPAPEATPCR